MSKTNKSKQFKLLDRIQFTEYVRSLVWSSNGDCLAIITAGGELGLWQKGKLNLLESVNDNSLDCVDFSFDGKLLATGGQSSKVKVWQLTKDCQLITTLNCGTGWIDSLVWNPTKNLLAFAVNREIKIWDANSKDIIITLNFENSSVFNLAWNPSGNLLAVSGHGGVKVWNSEDWKQQPYLLEVPGASLDCDWSGDGRYLASGNLDKTISLLHWDNPPPWLMQGFPGKVSQVKWSSNKENPLLAAVCQEGIILWNFDIESKNWQSNVLQHQELVKAIEFTPNSSLLTSGGDDDIVLIWEGKKLIQTIKEIKGGVSCLAWHRLEKYLAIGGQDGELFIYIFF